MRKCIAHGARAVAAERELRKQHEHDGEAAGEEDDPQPANETETDAKKLVIGSEHAGQECSRRAHGRCAAFIDSAHTVWTF